MEIKQIEKKLNVNKYDKRIFVDNKKHTIPIEQLI